MAAASKARKKQGYHHNDLRNAVLATALKFLVERHGPSFSLREIAMELGITHVSVYRHFADKRALIDTLAAEGFRELRRYQLLELEKASSDAMEELHALGRAYMLFARENPGFFALMFGGSRQEETAESQRESFNAEALSTLIGVIERGQSAGHIIPGDPRRLALYMVLAPHGCASYSEDDLAFIAPEAKSGLAETMLELSIVAILTKPPAPEEIARRYFQKTAVSEA